MDLVQGIPGLATREADATSACVVAKWDGGVERGKESVSTMVTVEREEFRELLEDGGWRMEDGKIERRSDDSRSEARG